jgi:hypothetical protein
MQKHELNLFLVLAGIALTISFCSRKSEIQNPLKDLLPSDDEIPGWFSSSAPQAVEGDDLYLIIDGGAEIVNEYGFRRAVFGSYENQTGKSVNLEIYEMEDAVSAYGMYTFKKGKKGIPMRIGHEAFLETYYLNVWKGPFLITLIGFDSDPETMNGLVSLAGTIDSKIQAEEKRPSLFEYCVTENAQKIEYIKGHLGLYNTYGFSAEDIFKVREGIIIHYENDSVLLIRYPDAQAALHIFQDARDRLMSRADLRDFNAENSSFSFMDRDQMRFHVKVYRNCIWMASGAGRTEWDEVFAGWKTLLDRMDSE